MLEINNKEVEKFTMQLRKMHKSDLPIVIRQTLNDLAFDTKQKTMPEMFKKTFINRNKSFLKSQTGVKKADGWNVNSMYSQVGVTPAGRGSDAAKGLTKQEHGGNDLKPIVYDKKARGGSNRRMVKASNYYQKFGKIKGTPTIANKYSRKQGYGLRSRQSNFIASAIMAHKLGKLLFWQTKQSETIFLINSVYLGADKIAKVNATPIGSYEDKRILNLKAKPFLKPASNMSQAKVNDFYIRNAERRLNKIKK